MLLEYQIFIKYYFYYTFVIRPKAFSKSFYNTLKDNNFEHIRFHDLRHANASMMINANVPVKIASNILGHSSTSITLDIYSHILKSNQKDTALIIDKILKN